MKRLALLALLAGCAEEVATSSSAITNGSAAPDDGAVVALVHRSVRCEAEDTPVACTGTLVAPRVVVTAAHCLEMGPANALEAFFGAVYPDRGTRVPVAFGRAHPMFDPATHANDVAVLVLAADAPRNAMPIAMRSAPPPDLAGTDVRVVGYGVTDSAASDVGTRRQGIARVTETGTDEIRMTPGPSMSCQGDSGGPVLAPTGAAGAEELVGVTSWGDPACTQFGVATRIDRYRAFVQSVVEDATSLPARRPFDPAEDFCAATCATDADCPDETICFAEHCSYRGLPASTFVDACTADGACQCVAMPDGACRELVPCFREEGDTCHAPAPADAGCGCRSSGDGGMLVVGALAVIRRRRYRSGAKNRSNA